LLIAASSLLDFTIILSLFAWARHGKDYRVVLAGFLFFTSRFAIQAIWIQEYPKGYNWAYPGVFSIFVPYGQTADFFFSGHVGACVLLFLEARRNSMVKL